MLSSRLFIFLATISKRPEAAACDTSGSAAVALVWHLHIAVASLKLVQHLVQAPMDCFFPLCASDPA
jgi:hypothetical protein